MALDIKVSLANHDSIEGLTSQAVEKIERSVTQNIYGGVNVFASERSSVTNTTSHSFNTSTDNQLEVLHKILDPAGLTDESISQLGEAIGDDSNSLGGRVKQWIKEQAPKVVIGGVKLGATAAQPVLTELIKKYLESV